MALFNTAPFYHVFSTMSIERRKNGEIFEKKTFITPIDRYSVRIVTFNPYLLRELWSVADRDDVVCISDKQDCGVYVVPSSIVPDVSGKAFKKYVEEEEKDAGNQMGQIERGYV